MDFYTGKPLSRMYDAFLDFNESTGVGRFCNGPTGTGFHPIYTACYEVDSQGREKSIPMPLTAHYEDSQFVADAAIPHDGISVMTTANSVLSYTGLATEDGRWVLAPSPVYDFIDYAGEGRWEVSIRKGGCKYVKDASCYYYVNSKGKADPAVEFCIADSFSEGLAAVTQTNGAAGYLNKVGSWGISPETLQKNLARWYTAEALVQYRHAFESTSSESDLETFIRKYQGTDPDNLVPKAKLKLNSIIAKEIGDGKLGTHHH